MNSNGGVISPEGAGGVTSEDEEQEDDQANQE